MRELKRKSRASQGPACSTQESKDRKSGLLQQTNYRRTRELLHEQRNSRGEVRGLGRCPMICPRRIPRGPGLGISAPSSRNSTAALLRVPYNYPPRHAAHDRAISRAPKNVYPPSIHSSPGASRDPATAIRAAPIANERAAATSMPCVNVREPSQRASCDAVSKQYTRTHVQ